MKRLKVIMFWDSELQLIIKWGELLVNSTESFTAADKDLLNHLIEIAKGDDK